MPSKKQRAKAAKVRTAQPEPEPPSSNTELPDWDDQPYYVINDEAYDRMLRKLQTGESQYEWSYLTQGCPHPPGQCVCPRHKNVLDAETGEIVRLVKGEKRPVMKHSYFLHWLSGPTTKTGSCILCKGEIVGYGNNPDPLSTTGRCCDTCNDARVIPARMAAWQ